MGAGSHIRCQFLRRHPVCCFCGGQTAATTIDHIPSRAIFDGRRWPEGYEFPACGTCNNATRKDELIVAMLARIYPDSPNEEHTKQTEKLIQSVEYNNPGLLAEMRLSPTQVRRFLRKREAKLPFGTATNDVPIISADVPRIVQGVQNFGRKLFCALHYKHASEIIPYDGGIAIKWFTNIQVEEGKIPQRLLELLPGLPTLTRCQTNLHDQFFYRYGLTTCKSTAVYLVFFRQSFAMLGWVWRNSNKFNLPESATILRPLPAGA